MDIAFTVAIISVLTALFIPIYLTIRFHIRLRLKHIKLWQLSLRSGVLLSTALAITVYVRHVYFNPYLNSELDLNAIMFVTWVIMFTLLSALFILISNLLLKQKFKGIEFKSKEILDQTTHD